MKKAPQRKERFDLNAAINEMIVLAQSLTISNGVSVRPRLAEGLFAVEGDRVQLQQVVLNLILNAVEAIRSVEAGARDLMISSEEAHRGVLVVVRDSGPGIDPMHLERVFEAAGDCQVSRGDGERIFPRGWRLDNDGNRRSVLVVLPAADHPSHSSLDGLIREYELKDEVDVACAVRPLDPRSS
jgi:hypothetical protein